jgi:uncharacterized membrane protein HdeD (DUF308 family)
MNLDFRSVLTVVLGVVLIVVGIITLARAKKYVPKDGLFFNRWGMFLVSAGGLLAEAPLIRWCDLPGSTCVSVIKHVLFAMALLLDSFLLFTGVYVTIFAERLRPEKWRRTGIRVIGIFGILISLSVFMWMFGWIK